MALSKSKLQTMSGLLDAAMELSESEHEAWINNLPEQPFDLKASLRALLLQPASPAMDEFLDTLPKFTQVAYLATQAASNSSARKNEIVGSYRLIRKIGQGGMSSVWLAERTDAQFKRQVALKLPHVNISHEQFTQRFARERDILAALTHPNIARLYDAGVTEDGQPFLALEYVDGIPIAAHCDEKQLSIRARIDLFLQVLEAVQYAHSHLIIHRDLKPSNILVTSGGQVALLDFGIAKLIHEGSSAETLLGGQPLTPDYASPEQISGQPLSTSTDVYSLGVLLYELLTGARPYHLERATRGALENAILTTQPLRPSQTPINAVAAQHRSTTPKKLRSTLTGDLDTIVLQAINKNPTARYATVDSFRQDIERFVSGHAVLAKPASLWYRFRKFVVRNRVAVSSAACVVGALLIGLALALWQANAASNQARIAKEQTQTAEAVQDFLEDLFDANSANQMNPEMARRTTARELLDRGSSKIGASLHNAPAAKMRVLKTLANMYHNLDLENRAADLARARVTIARSIYAVTDLRLARALVDLGDVDNSADLSAEAGKSLSEAEAIIDKSRDVDSTLRGQLAVQQGYHYWTSGDSDRGLTYAQTAIRLLRVAGPSHDLAFALSIKAGIKADLDEPAAAKDAAEEAVSIALHRGEKLNSLLPGFYAQLGNAQTKLTDFAGAEISLRQSVDSARIVYGPNTLDTLEMSRMLGDFYVITSRLEQALKILLPARDVAMKIAGRGDSSMIPALLIVKEAHGQIMYGRIEQAVADLELIQSLRNKTSTPSWVGAGMQEVFARAYIEVGQYADAAKMLARAGVVETQLGWDKSLSVNENIRLRTQLALVQGRNDEAERIFAAFRTTDGSSHSSYMAALEQAITRAEIMLSQGQAVKAASQASYTRAMMSDGLQEIFIRHYLSRALLVEGKALLLEKRAKDALPLLNRAVELDAQLYDSKLSPLLADAKVALANGYLDLGNRKRAVSLLADAIAIHAAHKVLGEQYRAPLRHLALRLGKK